MPGAPGFFPGRMGPMPGVPPGFMPPPGPPGAFGGPPGQPIPQPAPAPVAPAPPVKKEYEMPPPQISADDPNDTFAFANPLLLAKMKS